MRIRKFLLLIICSSTVAVSCASYYEQLLAGNDVDAKYKAAFGYFNKSKYIKSAKLFENLLLAVQGTAQEDTVQYYMALSNYRYGDYQTAEQGFEKFIEVFPRSPFTEEAKYLRIKCLYDATYRYELDQTPTKKAMAIINQFMNENPGSEYYPICKTMLGELQERLDKKNYEAARLYYNMEDYKAAHYALKNVLKENADNAYREDVLYYTALASYKYAANSIPSKQKERFMSFIDDYYNYIGEYSNTNERKALDNLYERAQKYTKKN